MLAQVTAKKYDESVDTMMRTLNVMATLDGSSVPAGRLAAGLVIVQLMRGDSVAASKAYEAFGGYCDGSTAPALRSLLVAFDEEDGEAAKEAINSRAIKDLDIHFARLAKQIPLPDIGALEAAAAQLGAQRAEAAEKEAAAAKSQNQDAAHAGGNNDDDDDDEDLL